jgi:DNA phosphorothioation-associated DGQHR protein 1
MDSNHKMQYPIKINALMADQPIGNFFSAVIPARILLEVAYSDVLKAHKDEKNNKSYRLTGTQRLKDPRRINEIREYINREDASFPNSIILAANFDEESGLIEEDSRFRWAISHISGNLYEITIPSPKKLASIIDGQHRLFAFADASNQRLDTDLLCSIYFDLPKAYQAQIFAIINSTQKPVPRSLTYELFGYNLEEEEFEYWSPDKLAVFLTRKLATEYESPLYGRIKISPKSDSLIHFSSDWQVSTSVVVDGITRLFTTNPKQDTNILLNEKRKPRSALCNVRADKSPLRDQYINGKDKLIYALIFNYLEAFNNIFWKNSKDDSFITRTVGVQASFDVLRSKIVEKSINQKDVSVKFFETLLSPAGKLDFSEDRFKNSSAAGRNIIKKEIEKML